MEQYFKDFEKKLQVTEEKLDILNDWHIAKGHHRASEIVEECRTTISDLWVEFYKLSEAYKLQTATAEDFISANLTCLFGEIEKNNAEEGELLNRAPQYILFDVLHQAAYDVLGYDNCRPDSPAGTVEKYLLHLIREDLNKRGITND